TRFDRGSSWKPLNWNGQQFRVREYRPCSSIRKEKGVAGLASILLAAEEEFRNGVVIGLLPQNYRHHLHTLELLTAENAEIGRRERRETLPLFAILYRCPQPSNGLLFLSATSGFSPRSLRSKALEV